MCETLYNIEYYQSLLDFILLVLKKDKSSKILLGTKTFYYGIGGGYFDFQQFVEKSQCGLTCKILNKINDMKSIERLVVEISYSQEEQNDEDTPMEQDDEGFQLTF